ncbi:MAG: DUF1697 domain-containing protein [Thaumarchaeota archaeon]|nr:DUF1697 domain-containing protein [Nitrososphaerota archaeon]
MLGPPVDIEDGRTESTFTLRWAGSPMSTFVSMLRGINVGGQKQVKMEAVKQLYSSLGLEDVRTYLQSGNVVFESSDKDVLTLARRIEEEIDRSFGFDVPVFLRTKKDLQGVVDNNPFETRDASKLHVTFLLSKPETVHLEELRGTKDTAEDYFVSGREIYLYCPYGYGQAKLSNNFLERKLKVTATTRNWRTVSALLSMT